MGEAPNLIFNLTQDKNTHIVWWAITPNLKRKHSASGIILDPLHQAGYRSFEGNVVKMV